MDITDISLYLSYILVLVGIILAVVMPLIKSLDDPKSLGKTLAAVVGLVVIFFIAYSISDGDVLPKFAAEPFNLTETTSKMVGGALMTVYVLFFIALAGIVVTEITKAVK